MESTRNRNQLNPKLKPRASHAHASGFTLVEILVVLAILMSLTGMVSVSALRARARARVDEARIQVRLLREAVRLYELEQGRIPTEEQGLDALVRRPARAPVPERYPEGGYLETREVPRDPWGNPYVYAVPGRDGAPFEILSYGRDGRPGGSGEDAGISSRDL